MMFRNATLAAPRAAANLVTTHSRLRALTGLSLLACAVSIGNAPLSAQRPPRNLTPRVATPASEKGQEQVKPTITVDAASGNVRLKLDSKGGMPLLDFVKWAQEVTGRRFTFNARELTSAGPASNVQFIGELAMSRDSFQEDFYAFFQTMLYIKGFAVIPRGEGNLEVCEIVMMAGARGREVSSSARYVAIEDLADYQHQAGVPILTTVPLEHIDAGRANNALRPFFASTGSTQNGSLQIGNVGDKSALLLQGFGPQVYAATQLLRLVDTPKAEAIAEAPAKAVAKPKRRTATQSPKRNQGRSKARWAAPQGSAGGQDMVTFSLKNPDGMELTEFIEWAQETTGKRFTFNPQELTAGGPGGTKIHILGKFQFPRKTFQQDFYAFFQTMLYIKGFAIVPRGEGNMEVLEIVMMHGHRGREITNAARYVAPEDVAQYRNQTGVPILTTVQLKNINAQLANNALRPFFASTGGSQAGGSVQIGNVGNSSALLLQGFGPQVYAAMKLLELVDGPAQEKKPVMQIVRLEHRSANEVESILSRLLQNGPPGSAQGYPGEAPLKVVADEAQAALILTGKKHQVRDVLDMIARLDVPVRSTKGTANVVRLKHAKAEHVAATLNAFLRDDNRAGAHPARLTKRTRKTVITAHKDSNSLLISAPGTRWKQIAALIETLDVPAPVSAKKPAKKTAKASTNKSGKSGFGFTNFGQAVFQDTDADGLPDTRLPDFDNPLQGTDGKDAPVIYLKTALGKDLEATLVRFLNEDQKANGKPKAVNKGTKKPKGKSVVF